MSYQASTMATAKLYKSVIDEVINGVREAFLDEGIDEQVLLELKQIWENKVLATKAVDTLSDHPPPTTTATSSSGSHSRSHQSSHSASAVTTTTANNTAVVNNMNSNSVVQTAPPAPSVVVTPAISATAAAAAGGFSHLAAGQHIYQSGAGPALATNFVTFQPGGPGQPLIIQPGGQPLIGNVNLSNVRYINAAQLPTIPHAQLMQVNQNNVAQQQRRNPNGSRNGNLPQVDGPGGISDDEDDFEDDDDAQDPIEEPAETGGVEEGEPLNSEDDVSNEDAEEMFEADNVVVCQYEKVTRTRNKWKFILKDGVMSLDGKDYVFNRANGEAEF